MRCQVFSPGRKRCVGREGGLRPVKGGGVMGGEDITPG